MTTAATPRERGIIMQAESVRRILEGRKTVTRRVVTLPKWMQSNGYVLDRGTPFPDWWGKGPALVVGAPEDSAEPLLCPYGKAGDRLWMREAFWTNCENIVIRKATDEGLANSVTEFDRWRSPIHMPRRLSRLTLEIVSVRVERVQEITREDCFAEGVQARTGVVAGVYTLAGDPEDGWGSPIDAFAYAWNRLNKERGYGWDVNPWVWRIEFRPLEVAG